MNNILVYCIEENKVSELLSYMTEKDKFQNILESLSLVEIEEFYKLIINKILESINKILYFGGHELMVIGNQFIINKIGSKIEVDIPNIKIINREYIKSLLERALKDITDCNFDSSITKARTILEETFCYVIEMKKEKPSESGILRSYILR